MGKIGFRIQFRWNTIQNWGFIIWHMLKIAESIGRFLKENSKSTVYLIWVVGDVSCQESNSWYWEFIFIDF